MNIYKVLNEIIEYIENNLEEDISYSRIAQIMGANEYTTKRVFSLLANISISEYIRNRRLSSAGYDLINENEKIVDIAVKYKYDNATSFSRAFEKFHGVKPGLIKNIPEKLRLFSRLKFDENINETVSMEYSIIELDEKILYGVGMKTTHNKIKQDAPIFFKEMSEKYEKIYGEIEYGMVKYEDRFDSDDYEYWIAYEKEISEFKKIILPKSKWLRFKIDNQEPKDIQKVSTEFYKNFIPSTKFNLKSIPELEWYHDNITEFLVAIE